MANEILKFLNGQSSNLASKTVQAGQVYFAINSDGETGSIYFDAPISSTVTKRIAMSGQSVEHANEADYATRDALGNIITDTYISQMRLDNSGTKIQYKYPGTQTWSELQPLFLPLAGGQITNDLGVNGTITAGNLIVNGAARFAQTILGNILSADKWSTARNFSISDATAAHTGTTVAVDGSAAVTLPLPATITATLKGNADTATTSTNATNLQAYNTNEVTIGANSTTAGASTNDSVWINYKDRSNGATNNNATKITHYYFGNRKGATTGVTVHADTFAGNASSADIWKTGRKFYISDSDASNTGTAVTVNGSQDYTLPLPATIKATLKGNADTATKATQDANGKVISTEYLHRVANSSSTLNQFSGAPAYLLGIESFANGGEVKWQAIADISVGNATTANTWKTARNFSISDDSAKNTGTTVSVNGGDNVVLPLPNQIYLTGNHAGFINGGETDKFFDFAYGANPTTSSGASWRIGALNSGSGDTNYFVIQTGGSTTNNTTWNNALRIGMNTLDIYVGGNLNPLVTNTKTLGTSDYKWKNVYATAFTGNLTGNADSATKWKDARKFSISDSDASHTGTQVSIDGSQDYVLPLPSTIKGTLEGNATTSTTASKLAVGASITTAENLDAFLEASKLKATIISTGVTYTDGTLSGNDGEVISIGYSNTTYGNQIFFDPDTDKISVRRKSTSWKPWVDLIHTGNISSYSAGSSSKWATSRKFSISDSDASHTGTQVSVDGSQDYVLPLPATIKASIVGHASEDLSLSGGTMTGDINLNNHYLKGENTSTNHAIFPGASGQDHQDFYEYGGVWNFYQSRSGTNTLLAKIDSTGIHANADSASKWATARNFAVADSDASHTGEAVSVDGTDNVTLKLPSTIKASLAGNATTATTASYANNLLAYSGNEVTIGANSTTAGSSTNDTVWFNYRDISGGATNNNSTQITKYYFGNRKSNTTGVTVYAETFSGNATSADKWKTGRKFSISDHDASNTGTQVTVNGTADYVLPLPATIKGTLKGNADTATVARYVSCPDTRSAVIKPEDLTAAQGVQFNFKQKSVTGLTAAYAGVMSFRPYSSASDWSGGPAHEVAFDNNGIYHRKSTDSTTWGAWETIIHSGNISTYASGSADKWTTPRNFYIADADAANTGDAVSVDGSANVTLKLPSTIKATLTGNASSATKAYVTIADTTKFYLIGSTNTSSGNADLKEDTGLYAGTTKGQLGAAYVGINGDNTSYRLYVNGTSLFTGLVNINTSTGTLKIGSQNSNWTHFEAQRDFYFNRQASINGNFLPYTDLTYNLGADSYRWSNVYANVLRLQGAASDPSTSAGARIEFTYDNGTSRSQGVYISYSPNDSYRAPGGLKVMGASDLGGSAWFEVEGATYSNGIIYAKATTDSSSTSTGALVVTGGVGIAKQLRVGDNTNIAGTLGVTKATTLSSTLTVSGNTSLNGNLTVASNKTTTLGGTLTVSGIATFSNQIKVEKDTDSTRSLDGNASIVTDGGVSVAKQLSAKMIKIDNGQASEGCQLKYNETNNCLEFVFS